MTQLTALYLELLKKEKSHSHGEGADSLWLEDATMLHPGWDTAAVSAWGKENHSTGPKS